VGINVGMIEGITRNKWKDKWIKEIEGMGVEIQVFWRAIRWTMFCSLTLGWLQVSGRFDRLYEVKKSTGVAGREEGREGKKVGEGKEEGRGKGEEEKKEEGGGEEGEEGKGEKRERGGGGWGK
ncbi:hypothetical protein JRC13_29820, partial [Escherichia coli]|nr:hypothetical protein [Escherichia coli]